jgi:hypothetical protein
MEHHLHIEKSIFKHLVTQALIIEDDETHCKSCGEWLDGCDMCPECGMIQK